MNDLIDTLLGAAEDPPMARLREQRQPARRHAEGTWRALVVPEAPGGLALPERAALALRVALIEGDEALSRHYRSLLESAPAIRDAAERFPAAAGTDRMGLLLAFADRVAKDPAQCDQATIDQLLAAGLSVQDVVAATQLIAFVPYQVRLMAGLRAMQGAA